MQALCVENWDTNKDGYPVQFSFDGRYILKFNDDAVSNSGRPITHGCSVRCVKD